MPELDLIELFVAPLEAAGARYLITGSIASTFYGEPRATHDIDLLVALSDGQLETLSRAFPAEAFYLPPLEVIRVEMARTERGHFNVIHHESGLKADFFLAGVDELHDWAFEHVRTYESGSLSVRLAPPEYVILRKLEFYREGGSQKHLRDIRAMLQLSRELIDEQVLAKWVRRRGLSDVWSEI